MSLRSYVVIGNFDIDIFHLADSKWDRLPATTKNYSFYGITVVLIE